MISFNKFILFHDLLNMRKMPHTLPVNSIFFHFFFFPRKESKNENNILCALSSIKIVFIVISAITNIYAYINGDSLWKLCSIIMPAESRAYKNILSNWSTKIPNLQDYMSSNCLKHIKFLKKYLFLRCTCAVLYNNEFNIHVVLFIFQNFILHIQYILLLPGRHDQL